MGYQGSFLVGPCLSCVRPLAPNSDPQPARSDTASTVVVASKRNLQLKSSLVASTASTASTASVVAVATIATVSTVAHSLSVSEQPS